MCRISNKIRRKDNDPTDYLQSGAFTSSRWLYKYILVDSASVVLDSNSIVIPILLFCNRSFNIFGYATWLLYF